MSNVSELRAELERLRAENRKLKGEFAKPTLRIIKGRLLMKIPGRRFPLTLYKEQWLKIIEHKEEILNFIRDNNFRLRQAASCRFKV